jgi:hypothetical protein
LVDDDRECLLSNLFLLHSNLTPAPAFAIYGRKEFQLALDQGIVGAQFQPIPTNVVRKKMKRSEARTIARVHKFLKDPKLPVRFILTFYSWRPNFLQPVVLRSTAASNAAPKAKSARLLALVSLAFPAGRPNAAGAVWRRHSTSASLLRRTLSRVSHSARKVGLFLFL